MNSSLGGGRDRAGRGRGQQDQRADAPGRNHLAWRAGAAVGAVVLGAMLGGPAVASAATLHSTGPAAEAPAVSTRLALSAVKGLPGQAVAFAGQGFRAGEKVTLHWRTATGTVLATVRAGKSGTVSGSFRVPLPRAGVPSALAVVAVGATSKREAGAAFDQSCSDEWTNLAGGDWSVKKDWSTGSVPGASASACVTLAGSKNYTVVLSSRTGSTTVGRLQVGATSGKTTQTLAVNPSVSGITLKLKTTSRVWAQGVLRLTSAADKADAIAGPGWLYVAGLLATDSGKGGTRYFDDSVLNWNMGTIDLGAPSNKLDGGWITNEGALNVGVSAHLDLAGDAAGPAGLIESAGSSTGVVLDLSKGTTSGIIQPKCTASACQNEGIYLAGKLNVTSAGSGPVGQYIPIYSQQAEMHGTFASVTAQHFLSYNVADNAVSGVKGDVMVSLP